MKRTLYRAFLLALPIVCFTIGCEHSKPSTVIPIDQQQRLDQLKSLGPDASLTILPVRVGGAPFDRVTEAVGWLLEQKGLRTIELGTIPFDSGDSPQDEQISASLRDFVQKNPPITDYCLYADFRPGILSSWIVDRKGDLVWNGEQTPEDSIWKSSGEGEDLLVCCEVVVRQLSLLFDLNEETAKNAKPGRMAAIMAGRSGIPSDEETAALPDRLAEMKKRGPEATLLVHAPRIGGATSAPINAENLVRMMNEHGLCRASTSEQFVLLKSPLTDPNEMKKLWDLAREFRDHVRQNPSDRDYVLYADYLFTPDNWEWGMVHFVVCDRMGEWVIVDMQNSHHPDYQEIKPTSAEGCDNLLVKRLTGFLK